MNQVSNICLFLFCCFIKLKADFTSSGLMDQTKISCDHVNFNEQSVCSGNYSNEQMNSDSGLIDGDSDGITSSLPEYSENELHSRTRNDSEQLV